MRRKGQYAAQPRTRERWLISILGKPQTLAVYHAGRTCNAEAFLRRIAHWRGDGSGGPAESTRLRLADRRLLPPLPNPGNFGISPHPLDFLTDCREQLNVVWLVGEVNGHDVWLIIERAA